MFKILLGSHGRLASGMLTSLEVLIGQPKKLTVMDCYVDGRNIDKELADFFRQLEKDDQVLMLSDLYGGSVNQKMYMYLQRPNTYLIAGVNLALLLEVCLRDSISKPYLDRLVRESRNMLRVVELDNEEIREDDFL